MRAEHVVVQAVDAALLLRRRRPQLDADRAGRRARRHLVEVADAHVLEAVRDALAQVGDVGRERSFVRDRARDALGDLHLRLGREVALVRTLRHRFQRAHTSVALQADAVLEEIFSGGFVGPGEHRAHHDAGRAEHQGLDDVARVADAAVRNHGNSARVRIRRHGVDRGRLGPATGTDDLRRADGADAHAHP